MIILVECTLSFQLKGKPLHYERNKERYRAFWPKIRHVIVDDAELLQFVFEPHNRVERGAPVDSDLLWLSAAKNHTNYVAPQNSLENVRIRVGGRPGTDQARRWATQWYQRRQISNAARDMEDEDVLIWADADEILSRELLAQLRVCRLSTLGIFAAHLNMFIYRFGCAAERPWRKLSIGGFTLCLLLLLLRVSLLSSNRFWQSLAYARTRRVPAVIFV